MSDVLADLTAEQNSLDLIVSELADADWSLPTPSPGWTIADQIGHLMYFDGTAALAITDPDAFTATVGTLMAGMARRFVRSDPRGCPIDGARGAARSVAREPGRARLRCFDLGRRHASRLVRAVDGCEVVPHGSADGGLGPRSGHRRRRSARPATATDRLRHIAQLGFITRGWSYINRGLDVPDVAVRVELTAPSGAVWTYGPDDASESVIGPAEDFCLVVTQRRHVDATALEVTGESARDWMLKAQAFAGAATDGPAAVR